jgi:hypothetical protein
MAGSFPPVRVSGNALRYCFSQYFVARKAFGVPIINSCFGLKLDRLVLREGSLRALVAVGKVLPPQDFASGNPGNFLAVSGVTQVEKGMEGFSRAVGV